MSEQTPRKGRGQAAALFLLVVLGAPVVIALLWGRIPWPSGGGEVILSPERGGRTVTLAPLDQAYLIGLTFRTLEVLTSGHPVPGLEDAPAACRQQHDLPVFITLYSPGREKLRAHAQQGAVAESVRAAAARLAGTDRFRARGFDRLDLLRVSIDVVTERVELPAADREQFSALKMAPPFGLALRRRGMEDVLLPGDLAGPEADDHLGMLRALEQRANLPPGSWQDARHEFVLLRTQSFMNASAGTCGALPVVRGLPLVRAVAWPDLDMSAIGCADYLVRMQRADGGLPATHNASGLTWGNASLRVQAEAAAALATSCGELDPKKESYLNACRLALGGLVRAAHVPAAHPKAAFVAPDRAAPASLRDTAAALRAFCAFRAAFADETWDDLIGRLARFLLLLQNEDGSFSAGYDPQKETSVAQRAAGPAAAEAARTLALAYAQLKEPAFLLAAHKALDRLAADDEALGDPETASRFLAATKALSAFLPAQSYMGPVTKALLVLKKRQLSPRTVPSPDLVGGALRAQPPTAGETARDMLGFACGCSLGGRPADAAQPALRAARFLVQFQFTRENSYYLQAPERAGGGLRERPGTNTITVESVAAALDALNVLAHVESTRTRRKDDSQSQP